MNPENPISDTPLILVTGPARSGKSEWAETLAIQSGRPVIYIATASRDGSDQEWEARIERHRHRRPSTWETLEEPLDLATTVRTGSADRCLLIDSLGTWLANLLDQDSTTWESTLEAFLSSLHQRRGTVILVAEETGWGVVPAYPLGRQFRDRLGQLVRRIGAVSNPVYLVTGGHILNLSLLGSPLDALIKHPLEKDPR